MNFIYGAIYFLLLPITASILRMIKSYLLLRGTKGRRKNEPPKDFILKKANKYVMFSFSHKKSTLLPYLLVLLGGLFIAIKSGSEGNYLLLILASFFFPSMAAILAYTLNKKTMKTREIILTKMVELKSSSMGLISKDKKNPVHSEEVQVTMWDKDLVTPLKVEMPIPVTFNELRQDSFLTQFNSAFGFPRSWIPDNSNPEKPGWDYNIEDSRLRLATTAPMPTFAPWNERYALSDDIAWSYFPLASGAQNGVKLTNPDTGEEEYILGFDLSGDQQKLAKKRGLLIGQDVVASPQVLISGATGSGKALEKGTLLPVADGTAVTIGELEEEFER